MLLLWKIRYFDRTDKEFKDRYSSLDTEALEATIRAKIELAIEIADGSPGREFLHYRKLFQEDPGPRSDLNDFSHIRPVFIVDYFEDEKGEEITINEVAQIQTGNPDTRVFPGFFRPHDIELAMAEEVPPPPVTGIALESHEIQCLGYFCRECQELSASAFMKDGPGKLTSHGHHSSELKNDLIYGNPVGPFHETAVSADEIRSYVAIFRRLYMENEIGNFFKAVKVYTRALRDHPYAKWLKGESKSYAAMLKGKPQHCGFVARDKLTATTKDLIDVFLYTQYAHQPDDARQKQYAKYLAEVQGKEAVLTWLFMTEIHHHGKIFLGAGKTICSWFGRYCKEHQIVPDIIQSMHLNPGIGIHEKEEDRRKRLLHEKAEQLANELWKERGEPSGGPSQFLDEAKEKLKDVE